MSIQVSIICLIYKSTKLLDAVYQSVLKYTPMIQSGEAELLFVANDATDKVLNHLIDKNYNFVSVKNTNYTEEELFKSGYGIPAYISNVYRGYNLGILNAKGEKIVLINSDNFFSDNWLENLLKYYDENKVISCQLVERAHEKFGVFPGAIEHYFGYNLDTFRDKDFNDFTKTIAREGLREGGAYMPSLLSKNTALKVGLYPTGNVANDTKENIKRYGDECFFDKLASIGVQHFTALDSISYHLKEGEREEVSEFDEKPIKIDLQKTNEKKEYPIIPYKEYENFFINNPDSLSETEIYNLIYQRKEPLVSIIIPVYNGANYMREAIDSALAQTYPNIEVIVVNDGSTDDTEKIALSYGDKIRYFSKENGGVATALNLAIQKSKGEYISWLSHDDVYYPNKIERQIKEIIAQKNPDLISYSDWITINEKSKTIGRMSLSENFPIYKLNIPLYPILNGIIHGCSLLIPKKCFDEIGLFDTNLETTQDYALWFKMFPNYQISYIPEALIKSRTHAEQGSRSIKTAKTEADSLWINMIEQLSEKQIYLLEGSHLTFYNKTLTLLKNAHYNGAVNYLENKIANLKKELAKENKLYNEFNCLQIGDNDLIGNKFNGHDLHLYLREKNIDANHIIMMKLSDDKNTFLFLRTKSEKKFTESLIFSDLFLDADIIHLHLIHNTLFDLNYLPIITAMKPTVITLHDPYFLGGHCIHHFDCEKWKSFCKDCPNLDSPFPLKRDSSAFEFSMKKHIIQNSNITAIVASKWMENKVAQSPIWQGKTIHRLPFGINQDIFKPEDKNKIRKDLNIPQDATVLMFRSDLSPFKGLDLIKNALKNLKTDKKIVLLTVAQKGKLKELKNKFDIREYGWLKDDKLLAKLYQASDLFLMPSTQEAFGMMAIEAMSCKVPVLALTGTALPDVINSPQCGLTVDADKFSTELQRLINTPEEIKERGEKSLTFAKENYDKEVYINKMINIYKEVIANHKTDAETEFVFEQLNKYAKNSELRKRFKLADNKLWRLFYKLTYRIYLKKRYGRKVVHEKYDKKYL